MNKYKISGKEIGSEIAIIGMAARFPGSKNVNEYWKNLQSGVESISVFSKDELIENGCDYETVNQENYVPSKGILEGVEYFDSSFFQYTPKEAEVMDPQIRIFHECAWHALEDAGYDPYRYKGAIGICAGASTNINWECKLALDDKFGSEGFMLANKDFMSTLISYKLNLKGPSMMLNTACSTSMTAIHQACRALLMGECKMMLAGGVSISTPVKQGYLYKEGMVMSKDGHCRPFDESASGTVGGSGAGIVVLKRLRDALNDRDNIYGIIKSSAINNDGNRKVGYTAPSVDGQAIATRAALRLAKVEPESIAYVETHGTGTKLGDPTEIQALTMAFNSTKKQFCGIGSVKSNIGHLDAASGIASFIKSALIIKNRVIPPTLNCEIPNSAIDFFNSPFYINDKLTEIKDLGQPLRVGVNSIGIGGTNVHVILEELPCNYQEDLYKNDHKLILLSARTKEALENTTIDLSNYLKINSKVNLSDVSYTLQVGRGNFKNRRMFICKSIDEAINILSDNNSKDIRTFSVKKERKQVKFVLTKMDDLNIKLALELYKTNRHFKRNVDECLSFLDKETYNPFLKSINEIKASDKEDKIFRITYQYSICKLLIYLGVEPDGLISDNLGECIAACILGVLDISDVLKIISHIKNIELGTYGGLTEGYLEKLKNKILKIKLNPSKINFKSSINNDWASIDEMASYEYWYSYFNQLMYGYKKENKVYIKEDCIFLEIGAGFDNLKTVEESYCYDNESIIKISNLLKEENSIDKCLLNILGEFWLLGQEIDWEKLYADEKPYRISLTNYPFEKQKYNIKSNILNQLNVKNQISTITDESNKNITNNQFRYQREDLSTGYVEPENELEIRIAKLLEEILGVHAVGRLDNFFELGVDSIKAIQLASNLRKFNYRIEVDEVLKYPNIQLLAEVITDYERNKDKLCEEVYENQLFHYEEIDSKLIKTMMEEDTNIEAIYPLSPMQKLIIAQNIAAYKKGNDVFSLIFDLKGNLDVNLFSKAWEYVIERHSILRTSFRWRHLDNPIQIVYKKVENIFRVYDWSNLSPSNQENAKDQYIKEEKETGFRVSDSPLTRLALGKLDDNSYKFIWTFQHSLFDGWSMHTIISEMLTCYKAFTDNRTIDLEEPKPFINYINWINEQDKEKSKKFWNEEFLGFDTSINLKRSLSEKKSHEYDILTKQLKLNEQQTKQIVLFSKKHNITINTIIQMAWAILIKILTDENDVIIGVETAGRSHNIEFIDRMVGIFITVVPVRVKLKATEKCLTLMKDLQEKQIEMRKHEYVTTQDIAKWTNIPLLKIQDVIYERTLVFQNFPMELNGTQFEDININLSERVSQINIPFRIYVTPNKELDLFIVFNKNKYEEVFVDKILNSMRMVLNKITKSDCLSIEDVISDIR